MYVKFVRAGTAAAAAAVEVLLDAVPLLVEVRFIRSGTSPDWYLCRSAEELHRALDILNLPGEKEVYVSSVWSLSTAESTRFVKSEHSPAVDERDR